MFDDDSSSHAPAPSEVAAATADPANDSAAATADAFPADQAAAADADAFPADDSDRDTDVRTRAATTHITHTNHTTHITHTNHDEPDEPDVDATTTDDGGISAVGATESRPTDHGPFAARHTATADARFDDDTPDLDAIERDLDAVDAALVRLAAGTYWTDEVTGGPLPDDVLAADPTARRA